MLALSFMKSNWKILYTFLILLNLGMVCIFMNFLLMHGYKNCDVCFECFAPLGCATSFRVFLSEILGDFILSIFLLSIFLPCVMFLRNRYTQNQEFFQIK